MDWFKEQDIKTIPEKMDNLNKKSKGDIYYYGIAKEVHQK